MKEQEIVIVSLCLYERNRMEDLRIILLFLKKTWLSNKNLMKIIMRDKNPLKSVTGFCTKNDRDSVENHLQYDFFLNVTKGYLIAL